MPVVALGWPADDPRITLERMIETRRDIGEGGLWLWLGSGVGSDPAFVRPYAVAWDGDALLVADPGAHRLVQIPARGRPRTTAEGVLESPIAVAACEMGIVVSESRAGKLALLDRRLRFVRWLAEGLERPTGLACLGDRVAVAETARHRVLVIGDEKAPSLWGGRGLGAGEFNFPTTLATDAGSLWVGDTLNFRVQRLDGATGEALGGFGRLGDAAGEMPRLKGVAIDAAGHLWVSDAQLDQVVLYDREGSFLMGLGRTGSGPGEFSFPAGVAAHPDGRVAVADAFNSRIQVFRTLQGGEGGRR